jgi:ATP-dependent HslUV protease subunit HslV
MGEKTIMKHTAKKVRRLFKGKVVVGFAGGLADALTLCEKFEGCLEQYAGNLQRAAVELAKFWREDKALRKLEAMLLACDGTDMLLISGSGEVIEPDGDVLSIGSGGNYALAAGRALAQETGLTAAQIARKGLEIAADICVFTNRNIIVEEV